MKRFSVGSMLASSVGASAVTLLLVWIALPHGAEAQGIPQRVAAENFSVMDRSGNERASLGWEPQSDNVFLALLDGSGTGRATIRAGADGTVAILLSGGLDRSSATLIIPAHGSPILALDDPVGYGQSELRPTSLAFYDARGNQIVGIP
jgi:hypothetical protein